MDLPGFGYSPMPHEQISIAGYARLLDGLLAELGIDAAAVIGNSMGGFIGAELAISFPQRVERLVLVSAAGLSTYNEPRAARATPALRRLDRVLAATAAWVASKSDTVTRRPRLRRAALNLVVSHPDRLPAALAAEQVRGAGKPGFIDALQAVIDYDVRERLPEIACPTLIVWGDRDRLISVRDAAVFEQLRAWRAAAAKEQGMPAYVIFHDATLREIAAQAPSTLAELAAVNGVGENKLARYGQQILDLLAGDARAGS